MANQNSSSNVSISVDLNNEKIMPTPNIFEFPYCPYPSQITLMQSLYSVVEAKKQGIFESPTGTGKTMSILCGILTWLKNHEDRIQRKYTDLISELQHRFVNDPSDWFLEQSRDIILRREIDKIKIEQNKLDVYLRKLSDIANRKEKHKNSKFPQLLVSQEMPDEIEDTNADDQFLLEDEHINTPDTISEDEKDEYKPTQIFICSRTHSQLAQFVEELKKSPFGENTRIVTLASRQNTCICPSVKKLVNSAAINERCLEMQKSSNTKKVKPTNEVGVKRKRVAATVGKCPFYNRDLIEDLSELALSEPQDIEDLVLKGEKMRACSYYASRKASKLAEIILAPYNTILHRETREANGIDLKGNVLIIDEAHNLLDALCAMNGVTLNEHHIITSIYQLSAYKQHYNKKFSAANLLLLSQTVTALEGMRDFLAAATKSSVYTPALFLDKADISYLNIHSLCAKMKRSLLLRKVQGFAKFKPQLIDDIVRALEEKKLKKKPFSIDASPQVSCVPGVSSFLSSMSTTGKSEAQAKTANENIDDAQRNHTHVSAAPLHTMLAFMQAITSGENSSRILLHCEKGSEQEPRVKRSLEYLVLDPSQQFADVVKDCRSVIVAGGTMKPIEEIKHRLFVKAGARRENVVDSTWGHIIPPENIAPIIVAKAGKSIRFDFQNRNSMVDVIVNVLKQFSNSKTTEGYKVRGGIVVFFTSYQYMNWVVEQTKGVAYERPLFIESQEQGTVQRILDEYTAAVRRNPKCGAMIFCVMGGKLSEGINFKDELGRLVILFGLPYPYQESIEYKEKLVYVQLTEGAKASKEMGLIMCMKTVNQCIGRAIRHKGDFAAVLLVDERYMRTEVQALLPDWIQTQLQQYDLDSAVHFVASFLFGLQTITKLTT